MYDDNGNPQTVAIGKDPYAIKYFNDLGLMDEAYRPAQEFGVSNSRVTNWGARFQAQLRLALAKDLTGSLGFNISKGSSIKRDLIDRNSLEMKRTFNNFTKKVEEGDEVTRGEVLIPLGGRIKEARLESMNYLLRGQLQYDKTFDDVHRVTALLGSEIRATKLKGVKVDKIGYDSQSDTFDNLLNYKDLDNGITGTFAENGGIAKMSFDDSFSEIEDRFFSLYGNMSYNYDGKYIVHGSIRVDQSNLFGTDPKYRYKPFWSAGLKWRVAEEDFFNKGVVSRLDLQCSYGLNGNISNSSGHFDLAEYNRQEKANNALGLEITSPKINDLRWEKIQTFNIGLQTGLFKDRVGLNFDYYIKKTTDVLAVTEIDPTLGYPSITKNDATLLNQGFELSLNTVNVKTDNFSWSTFLGLNFNESLVENAFLNKNDHVTKIVGTQLNMSGYEPYSIFLFKYLGVNDKGNGMIDKAGKQFVVDNNVQPELLTYDDVVCAGTTIPKFIGRLTNNLSYKNFDLSFMFIYQGGHILLKDSFYGGWIYYATKTLNKDVAKAWKKPGDEKKEGVLPRVGASGYWELIQNSTKNVIEGDYLRLRDVVLSYTLPQSFISKNKYIKDCRIDLKGRNLFLWTKNKEGIDPEAHGIGQRYYPVVKSVSLGVNLIF